MTEKNIGLFINDSFIEEIKRELSEQNDLQLESEFAEMQQKVKGFKQSELSEDARKKRLSKAASSFQQWDKIYFPPENFEEYAPYGAFHKTIEECSLKQDKCAHIIMGPRDCAKTSLLKRIVIWMMLHGKRKYIGWGSGTLRTPKAFMMDVYVFLTTNKRINQDYKIRWIKRDTSEGYHIMTNVSENASGTFLEPLSEERSTKGGARNLIDRYDLIILTDFENEVSSLEKDSVQKRIDRINEMRTSLSAKGALICEGNNFHIDCALNHLRLEQEKGILSEYFKLYIYPAWDSSRPGLAKSVWYSRYPARTEQEMKAFLKPKDKYDWAGNFQQKPIRRGADIFPEEFYQEWDEMPKDLKSVIYTDPNLSKKGKGDTTAAGAMGYSFSKQAFYIPALFCKSYSDSNELLSDIFNLRASLTKQGKQIYCIGMDGSVSQESHWSMHVRNYAKNSGFPVPYIDYKNYKVDALIKNAESIYKNRQIFFPPGFIKTETGAAFMDQFCSFKGKKAGKVDDAPDWFICAIEMLFEMSLVMYGQGAYYSGKEIISHSSRDLNKRL